MTTREAKEDALVTDLEAVITEAQIDVFPDDFGQFKGKKDKVILVAYVGKRRISEVNKRGSLQNYFNRFLVSFMYRNRRTHHGLLTDLKLAEDKLAGKKIDNNFRKLVDERFVTYDQKTKRWIFEQEWELFERYDNSV